MQKLDLLNLPMRTHAQLSSIANQIIHLSNKCTSLTHIHQIQAQLILQNLRSNSNVAHHFITACHSHSLDQLYSALFLFTQLPKPHIFIYNTLIRAFSHARTPYVPNYIYVLMHKNSVFPNNYTFPFLLKSLTDFKQFKQGQCVHTHVVKLGHFNDIYVQNALLNVYSSCGRMRLCQQVFGEMPMRDVVSWTILIMGFGRSGKYGDALIAFEHMKYAGIEPNHVTMVNALAACGNIGAIDMGVWIHDYVRSKGWELDVILGTSLVDMYGKCGRVEESLNVFRSMTEKNTLTWNVLVKMLGLAKSGEAAVWWFDRMVQEGFKVDDVTLVAVLSACSHSGLIDKARQIFLSLLEGKYGILPSVKHYACMTDLLSRSGCLSDAFYYIREMPFEPTKSMWGSLLAGCRHHGNLELGEIAAKNLVQLEPQNSAYYVLLSNLYAEMGRWDDVTNVRELMKERGLAKDKGCSSVELQVQSHDIELLAV